MKAETERLLVQELEFWSIGTDVRNVRFSEKRAHSSPLTGQGTSCSNAAQRVVCDTANYRHTKNVTTLHQIAIEHGQNMHYY